jgi:hypothetical protein
MIRWLKSKRLLEQELMNCVRQEIPSILERWFRDNIFELNIKQRTALRHLDQIPKSELPALRNEMKRKCSYQLAEMIFNDGTYFAEIVHKENYDA